MTILKDIFIAIWMVLLICLVIFIYIEIKRGGHE